MTVALSVSWDDSKKKRRLVALLVLVALMLPLTRSSDSPERRFSDVIIQSLPGRIAALRDVVAGAGGIVTRDLPVVGGLAASIPSAALGEVRRAGSVWSVTPDTVVELQLVDDGYDPATDPGSLATTARVVGAPAVWAEGITGGGVDVALIDTGVVTVDGLDAPGKLVHGPDLTPEADDPALDGIDGFGHGTHMAGLIAGRSESRDFTGIAPDARIVSLKVASADGSTTLSRLVEAIGWVVAHRDTDGMNIRVLNLSFGAVADDPALLDPLVHAVDAAWDAGIVVVVAAGNRGEASDGLSTPGRAPQIIAVGADDPRGSVAVHNDVVPAWSSSGNGIRDPDLVAPGLSVVSLRDPGSFIDTAYPGARVGSRFFRGSGTSISTAITSGAAALLVQQRPDLTPDQVKALLTSTAEPVPDVGPERQGAGLIDVAAAAAAPTPSVPPDPGSSALLAPTSDETTDHGDSWSGNSWSGNSWSFEQGTPQ